MTDKITVVHSDGSTEIFRPRLISQAIMKETGVNEELAIKIQKRITAKFYKLRDDGLNEISTSQIRAEVSSQLLKEREFEAEEQTRKLGMSVGEFEDLLENGCKDNANIGYSPEMIAKYAYDSIAKEYALLKMPEECAEAYKEGLIHIHDMEYYMTRPNCMNYDLRFFAKNGLKIDGKGAMGSVSKPAKSLEVLLNHMLQAWMAGATVFSGGQGYVNFNTLLSPFCRGRSYKDIKQAIQGFIFNCNESLICRGGQVLFSSIALDLSCPDVLKDEPAISFEGIAVGTYKDYQEEADLIFKAVCEVSNEKDGQGAYHRFPNLLFNIRKGDLDEYKGTCKLLHETGANNPTIYYNNCIDLERSTMGCRSSLPMNYRGTYEEDCVNTGNFMYNTINLPLLALEADGDIIINGAMGITGTPKDANFMIGIGVLLISLVIVLNLINSRDGRAIMAIRDNHIAAEASGINVTRYKMLAFTISAAIAGSAGVLYSHNITTLTASSQYFGYNASIMILVYVVLGGIGNIRGSVVAACILYLLPELLRGLNKYRMLIYSIVLIVMMIVNWSPKVIEWRKRTFANFGFKKKVKVVK